jgi:hypothetical protein
MLNRDLDRERPQSTRRARWPAVASVSLANEGLASFRRAYRWLNLSLVQQGLWPLLVIVLGAPWVPIALTPLPWYWARLGGPLLAALLALAYLGQRPEGLVTELAVRDAEVTSERDRRLREQVTILIVGVTVAVAILRLLQGPSVPVLKLEAFGLADVAAYQAINFGVVGRSVGSGWERLLPVVLFGLSWGAHDLFLAASSPQAESLVLTFAGSLVVGLIFGAISWGLWRWPGGYLCPIAAQFLLVYLVLGFLA